MLIKEQHKVPTVKWHGLLSRVKSW